MWTAEVFNEEFSENQSTLKFTFLKQSKQAETNEPLRRELGIHSSFLLYVGVLMGIVSYGYDSDFKNIFIFKSEWNKLFFFFTSI